MLAFRLFCFNFLVVYSSAPYWHYIYRVANIYDLDCNYMIFNGELRTTTFQTYTMILGASCPHILIGENFVVIYEILIFFCKSED